MLLLLRLCWERWPRDTFAVFFCDIPGIKRVLSSYTGLLPAIVFRRSFFRQGRRCYHVYSVEVDHDICGRLSARSFPKTPCSVPGNPLPDLENSSAEKRLHPCCANPTLFAGNTVCTLISYPWYQVPDTRTTYEYCCRLLSVILEDRRNQSVSVYVPVRLDIHRNIQESNERAVSLTRKERYLRTPSPALYRPNSL